MPKKNKTLLFANSESLDNTETEIKIVDESNKEVEVSRFQSYGCGIDCHSKNIVVSVHVRRDGKTYERHETFATTWNSLLAAKEWAVNRVRTCSDPVPDLSLPFHYTIEATANYHMPVITAWEGKPSIINPALAGATKRKSDPLDAARLSYHDLTGIWRESFPISREIHELRVLLTAREHFDKLATQGGKITGKKTRGGCRILHAALIQCAFIIISNASEAFGNWGARFAEITKKKKKAANAVARKLNTALYYMMTTRQKFSYENYTIAKESATFNIPVEELLVINPSFKQYIKYLIAADIHTTSEMVVAYLSRKLDSIRGLGLKFFTIFKDFLHNQPKYKKYYINLKKGAIQDA